MAGGSEKKGVTGIIKEGEGKQMGGTKYKKVCIQKIYREEGGLILINEHGTPANWRFAAAF